MGSENVSSAQSVPRPDTAEYIVQKDGESYPRSTPEFPLGHIVACEACSPHSAPEGGA